MNDSMLTKEIIANRIGQIKERRSLLRYSYVYEIVARLRPNTAPICNLRKGTPEHDFYKNAKEDIDFLLRVINTRVSQ